MGNVSLNRIKSQATKNLDFGTHIAQPKRRKGGSFEQLANIGLHVAEKVDAWGNRQWDRPTDNLVSIV
jgi:hypothetical protein